MIQNARFSFVIPCYQSEHTIADVVRGIREAFPADGWNTEIVLVNDGSSDRTFEVIAGLARQYDNVTAVDLSRNFGQDAALLAGYALSGGDYIISLDDDEQNPPAEAHKLIRKIGEGYDVVFGKYHEKHHSWFRNLGSRFNDRMACAVMSKPRDLTLGSFFIMNRFVAQQIIRYDGAFPYVWGLILRTTNRIANEYIGHEDRAYGRSTFTFAKLVNLWMNGFISFSVRPLRIAPILGALACCIGVVLGIVSLAAGTGGGTAALALLLAGILLLCLGMLGEYIGRAFINQNRAPLYIIREKLSGGNPPQT